MSWILPLPLLFARAWWPRHSLPRSWVTNRIIAIFIAGSGLFLARVGGTVPPSRA